MKNINNPRFIGLKNLGSTCYINAVIQCFVNIDKLTRYLLNNEIYFFIIKNDNCEILNGYCQLLEKLCCDEDIENKYNPEEFIKIINNRSSLFRDDKPNDSKDFLYFLLEQMNDDFNQIQLKLKNYLNYININRTIYENIQNNRDLMLINFINYYSSKNNNIIPRLFFSIIEFETICKSCKKHLYNFQTLYSLEFCLEEIYNKINNKSNNFNNYKCLSLDDCFSNYNETVISNTIYCKSCKSQKNATYNNSIYSLPPILIITLNRGKNNKFNCDVDFPETLNVQKYIHCPFSNYKYSLIGVVSYYHNMINVKGHFIAFCKHRIIKDWYCYDDEKITYCDNLFRDVKSGTPYILIYESTQEYENMLFNDNFLLKEQNNNNMNNNNKYNNNMKNNMNNIMNNNNINFEENMNFKNMNMTNYNIKNNININNINNINNRTNININKKNNKIFKNNMNNKLLNNLNNNNYSMNNLNSNMNNNNINKMNYFSNKINDLNYINNNKIDNNEKKNMNNNNMNNYNMNNNNMNNINMNYYNMNNNNMNSNMNNYNMNYNNMNNNNMNNNNNTNNNNHNNGMNNKNNNYMNNYMHNNNMNNQMNNQMNNNNMNNYMNNNMNNNKMNNNMNNKINYNINNKMNNNNKYNKNMNNNNMNNNINNY